MGHAMSAHWPLRSVDPEAHRAMASPVSARLRWERHARRWSRHLVERFGPLGLIGIGLLVLALVLGIYAPWVTTEAEDLRGETDRMRGRLDDVRRDLAQRPGSLQRAAALRESFPTVNQTTSDLRLIFEAAQKSRIELVKGEYALAATEEATRLRRFEVTLPVKERYVTIKAFVAGVLNTVPHASLAELRLERSAANVDQIDARVHFTLFYREK